MKEYSIIWKTFSVDSDLGEHLNAKKDFSLPYFIDGVDKERFEKRLLNNLEEIHLLRGIFVGYFDNPPIIDTKYSKQLFIKTIEDLRKHFQFDTTEKLILDISSFIRQENGDYASHIALLSGLEILPENSRIRFDLCVDLYNMLERNEYSDKEKGLKLLKENLEQINLGDIRPEFIENFKQFKEFIENQTATSKNGLINYMKANNRVCPQPQLWNKLWRMLKNKERVGVSGWKPPFPLLLAAWWDSSVEAKRQRLLEHIDWAETKGQLDSITAFIYNLKEEEWYHTDD